MTLQLFELFYPGETTKRPHHDFHRRLIFLQDLFQRGFSFILDKAIKLGVWHLRESKRTWHNDDISLAHLPPSSCKVHIRHGPRHSQVYASFRRHVCVCVCACDLSQQYLYHIFSCDAQCLIMFHFFSLLSTPYQPFSQKQRAAAKFPLQCVLRSNHFSASQMLFRSLLAVQV